MNYDLLFLSERPGPPAPSRGLGGLLVGSSQSSPLLHRPVDIFAKHAPAVPASPSARPAVPKSSSLHRSFIYDRVQVQQSQGRHNVILCLGEIFSRLKVDFFFFFFLLFLKLKDESWQINVKSEMLLRNFFVVEELKYKMSNFFFFFFSQYLIDAIIKCTKMWKQNPALCFCFCFRFYTGVVQLSFCWSSSHVLLDHLRHLLCRGSSQRPFSLLAPPGFEPQQPQSQQQVPVP